MDLLGIYLNDHLAGATGGRDLAHRIAHAHHGRAAGPVLQRIATEITEDRAALLEIMGALGVRVWRVKLHLVWLAEKVARLKPNGRLVGRSPLSDVIELEALRLGVEGKAAGWTLLLTIADDIPDLDRHRLDVLLARAREQAASLEELRLAAAVGTFTPGTRAGHES